MESLNNLAGKIGKLALATAIITSPLYSTGCTTTATKPITKYFGISEIEVQILHPFPEPMDYNRIKKRREIPNTNFNEHLASLGTYQPRENKKSSQEFEEYLKINPNNLTERQKQYLEEFKSLEKEAKIQGKVLISEEEKAEIKENYPFINLERLTTRDKVYLIQDFENALSALSVFSF